MREISTISTINAPKWRRSTVTWKFAINSTFLSTEAPLDYKWQIGRKTSKLKRKIFKCLPNLQETLIKIQSFQSICHKIRVKFKKSTPSKEQQFHFFGEIYQKLRKCKKKKCNF